MNKYRKYTDVYSDLLRLVTARRSSGLARLPSEIEMTRIFKTSRMTLRKAMNMAQNNGIISRIGKRTLINSECETSLRKCGKIIFIATSEFQPAIERLWYELSAAINDRNGDISLFIIDRKSPADKLERMLKSVDIALLANIFDCSAVSSSLVHWKNSDIGKKMVALSDPLTEILDYSVALDNYAAGKMAINQLVAAGCQKILLIADATSASHSRRVKAAYSELRRHNIEYLTIMKKYGIDNREFYSHCRKRILRAYEDGFDGAFLVSDEGCETILADLFSCSLVPEKFKVITVNGSGQSMRHQPPLSSISHATAKVAAETIKQLLLWQHGSFPEKFHIAVKPDFHKNFTI